MVVEPFPYACALEAQLPRSLILANRDAAPAQDLRDCAALLMKTGRNGAAELLLDAARFRLGMEPDAPFHIGSGPRGSTWGVATDALSDMISVADHGSGPLEASNVIQLALDERRHAPASNDDESDERSSRAWTAARLGSTLKVLLSFRDIDSSDPDFARRALAVQDAIEEVPRWDPVDLSTLPEDSARLAAALAFNAMRRVVIERGELARSPLGHPALFHESERLASAGLGVGFGNLTVLAPTWPEIRLLIEEAWGRLPRQSSLQETVDRFGALLSIGVPSAALRTLIDDLADAGHSGVLAGILLRMLREPLDHVDGDLLRTMRDAFLDLGNLPLAIAAQRHLVFATGSDAAETAALDELEASLKNRASINPSRSDVVHPSSTARPPRNITRRSGFASTAIQRQRRFHHL